MIAGETEARPHVLFSGLNSWWTNGDKHTAWEFVSSARCSKKTYKTLKNQN